MGSADARWTQPPSTLPPGPGPDPQPPSPTPEPVAAAAGPQPAPDLSAATGSRQTPTEALDYAALIGAYGALLGRRPRSSARGREPIRAVELPALAAATFALSKLIVHEKVESWMRRAVRRGAAAAPGRRAGGCATRSASCSRARAAPAPGPRSGSSRCACTRPATGRTVRRCSPPRPATTCSTPGSRGCARGANAPVGAGPPRPRPVPVSRSAASSALSTSGASSNSSDVPREVEQPPHRRPRRPRARAAMPFVRQFRSRAQQLSSAPPSR